jgi:hypothetical protein
MADLLGCVDRCGVETMRLESIIRAPFNEVNEGVNRTADSTHSRGSAA